ncbi:MAG: hypothetical protein KC543_10760 [Myxococcales bacterium]|nr:hypothetical protein [Myxococcales bacterium]
MRRSTRRSEAGAGRLAATRAGSRLSRRRWGRAWGPIVAVLAFGALGCGTDLSPRAVGAACTRSDQCETCLCVIGQCVDPSDPRLEPAPPPSCLPPKPDAGP